MDRPLDDFGLSASTGDVHTIPDPCTSTGHPPMGRWGGLTLEAAALCVGATQCYWGSVFTFEGPRDALLAAGVAEPEFFELTVKGRSQHFKDRYGDRVKSTRRAGALWRIERGVRKEVQGRIARPADAHDVLGRVRYLGGVPYAGQRDEAVRDFQFWTKLLVAAPQDVRGHLVVVRNGFKLAAQDAEELEEMLVDFARRYAERCEQVQVVRDAPSNLRLVVH